MKSKNLSCESLALKNCVFWPFSLCPSRSLVYRGNLPVDWSTLRTTWITMDQRTSSPHCRWGFFLLGPVFQGSKELNDFPDVEHRFNAFQWLVFICFCYLCFFSCHLLFLLSFCWPGARYYDLHVFLQEVHSSMTKAQLQRRYGEILPSPMLRAFGGDGSTLFGYFF